MRWKKAQPDPVNADQSNRRPEGSTRAKALRPSSEVRSREDLPDLPQDPGYRIQIARQDAREIRVVRWRRWLLTIASTLRRYESGFRGDQQSDGRNKNCTQCYESSSLQSLFPFVFVVRNGCHRGTRNASFEVSLAGVAFGLPQASDRAGADGRSSRPGFG